MDVIALGLEAQRRNIDWFHLPNVDGSTPCPQFERAWASAGEALRTQLRNGFDVVVHCKGGLGRAGLVAAIATFEA